MPLSHCRLGVNVDHVATLRQARRSSYPDPVYAALLAEAAGADQITIHLREDRRHIQDRDLQVLRQTVRTLLNLEMAATQEMVKSAYEMKPNLVTLVPERREEITTEGGLDVVAGRESVGRVIRTLKDAEIEVSVFIDPDVEQVKTCHRLGADRIELHTGRYCEARIPRDREREMTRLVDAVKSGRKLGLAVAAGHGLNYENVLPVAAIAEIEELNIGHAIVARAVMTGMDRAVREMIELYPLREALTMRVLTADEMRRADRATIDGYGIPGLLLMEHAARAVAEVAASELGPRGAVIVVCGTGNNAGDGWAAARLLHLAGHRVRVVPLREASLLHGDASVMARAYEKVGGPVVALGDDALGAQAGDVVVDAIFGTGLDRAPEAQFHRAIEAIHAARGNGAVVVAVDIPSGVSADTGRPFGIAVKADATVTFAFLKRGLVLHPGAELAGTIKVADISIPRQVLVPFSPRVELLGDEEVRRLLAPRPPDSHKGNFGHVLLVAGSEDKPGAAALAALGALRGGAGLVSVASRPGALDGILRHAPEIMAVPLPGAGPLTLDDLEPLQAALEGKAALLVGPGIPRGDETGGLVTRLLELATCPVVLDADALNAIAGRPGVLPRARKDLVVTPHPGEMARLTGLDTGQVQLDRIGVAQHFASEQNCVVVLKGAATVIAEPGGDVSISPVGNPGLATGGTGDVLGGLLASQLAQGLPGAQAAAVAVYVHGRAADLQAKERGERGLIASDVAEGIAAVWAEWGL